MQIKDIIKNKMTFKNKTLKLISGFLIVSILAPAIFLSAPKKADASFLCSLGKAIGAVVPTNDSQTSGSTGTSCITNVKTWLEYLLKEAGKALAKAAIEKITQSMVNWINSGFHGQPLFLENPDSFFKDIAKFEVRKYVDMFGYDSRRFPFGKAWALSTISAYKSTTQSSTAYTLSNTMSKREAERFRNDFSAGGWEGFFINTQHSQNNYLGFQMQANEALALQLEGTLQAPAEKIQKLLQQGQGFLSPQKCMDEGRESDNSYNEFNQPPFDAAAYEAQHPFDDQRADTDRAYEKAYWKAFDEAKAEWDETNTCKNLVNTTPGSVVGDQIKNHLGSGLRNLELDAAVGNGISLILDALINHFIKEGLSALSNRANPPPPDNWSYNGQTLDGSGGTPPGSLNIPQNVSVNIGQNTSKNISSGTTPYVIETPPTEFAAIAGATISGSTLTITGINAGQTSIVVKDSSLPVKRATVQITVLPPEGLTVIPANITIEPNDQATATISGGAEPYSMITGPNETIANVLFRNTILIVNGIAPGRTSVIIKDSSRIPKTITINIEVKAPPEAPTVTLTANPTTIQAGQNSILSWTSSNATSCLPSWTFAGTPTSGSSEVNPGSTTTYSISCTNSTGQSGNSSTTVTVN